MKQFGSRPAICDPNEQPELKVRLSVSIPNIKLGEFPEKAAGDIDMRKYKYRGHHGSRCVIL